MYTWNRVLILILLPASASFAQTFDWVGHIGAGGSHEEVGTAITVDIENNLIIVGHFDGNVDFDPGPLEFEYFCTYANADAYVLKLDDTGNFIWAKRFGGTGVQKYDDVCVDSSGNIYTVGTLYGYPDFGLDPSPTSDIFLQKLSPSGDQEWVKKLNGAGEEVVISVSVDAAGSVYVDGNLGPSVDFDPGPAEFLVSATSPHQAFLLKLDSLGNFKWVQVMDATYSSAGGSAVDNAGNIVSTGSFCDALDLDAGAGVDLVNTGSCNSAFIRKVDSLGNHLWGEGLTVYVDSWVAPRELTVDTENNIIIVGMFSDEVDFDPGAGEYELATSTISDDMFLLKFTPSGEFSWARRIGSYSTDSGPAVIDVGQIATDLYGNIYATGYFNDTVDFDPGPGLELLTQGLEWDQFILRLDSVGGLDWAVQIGGKPVFPETDGGDALGYGICVDAEKHVFTTGKFFSEVDFDPGADQYLVDHLGYYDVFVLRLNQDPSGIFEEDLESIIPFPNPTDGPLYLPSTDNKIEVFSADGVALMQTEGTSMVDLTGFASGVYFVNIDGIFYCILKR